MEYPQSLDTRLRTAARHLTTLADALRRMAGGDVFDVLEELDDAYDAFGALGEALEDLEGAAVLSVDAILMSEATDAQIRAALDDWD